jgi:putative transposase
MKRSYQTDLTDAEWKALKPHVPAANKRGRPRIHSPREILDAVFYLLRSGCPWRLLPREFPPWETVYSWFRKWSMDGTFERLNALSCASSCAAAWAGTLSRARASPTPRRPRAPGWAANREGLQRPQEGSRQSKRHILVDTDGLLLKAKVHSAKVPEQDGLRLLLESARGSGSLV